jgi:hypothetical protein
MVQRRSGRFVTSTYSREPGTVTKIMQDLKWQTLETRRKAARLILFHKAINGEAVVTIPEYVRKPSLQLKATCIQITVSDVSTQLP